MISPTPPDLALFAADRAAARRGGWSRSRQAALPANVYLDLGATDGFSENTFVGRKVRIGSKVVICVLERDPRCQMITLDPDTAAPNPEVLHNVVGAVAKAKQPVVRLFFA